MNRRRFVKEVTERLTHIEFETRCDNCGNPEAIYLSKMEARMVMAHIFPKIGELIPEFISNEKEGRRLQRFMGDGNDL